MNMTIYNNTDQTVNSITELLDNNPLTIYIPTKVCNTYRIIKLLTEFYKREVTYDGYIIKCKTCRSNRLNE